MANKVKILYNDIIHVDGVDFVTKIQKSLPDSGLKYQVKTEVAVYGRRFVDYSNHLRFKEDTFDNETIENQLNWLSMQINSSIYGIKDKTEAWYDFLWRKFCCVGLYGVFY